jgi:5-formyltetrahydrofolate cyclo-ligase
MMDKNSLRRSYLSARKSLTQLEIASKNHLINQRLINYVPWSNMGLVHLYLPVLDQNEVDTMPTITHIRSHYEQLKIAVPKVEPAQELSHHLLTKSTKLESNLWGIPEPVGNSIIDVKQIDLVIAPLIIFDKAGHRIGYGKGYYDRFLAHCRSDTKKIGLCYFDPVEKIDIEPTDISMNSVITPEGVWEF